MRPTVNLSFESMFPIVTTRHCRDRPHGGFSEPPKGHSKIGHLGTLTPSQDHLLLPQPAARAESKSSTSWRLITEAILRPEARACAVLLCFIRGHFTLYH